jgi:divalent metal cation (Fe/Co/Zn/Cd) transporter
MSTAASATAPHPSPRSAEWVRAARLTRLLSWVSLFWLAIEGTVAIVAGVMAGSVALIAFGLDSAIEGVASTVIIWRFSGSRLFSERAERRAQFLVALQFFILVPFITYEAVEKLVAGAHIETSWLGIGLTIATLAICQPLGYAKRRLGERLGSRATVGEGTQNLLCGYMALAVLGGLLANAFFGLWWLDPIVALFIAGVALREGRAALRGDDVCCGSCGPALDTGSTATSARDSTSPESTHGRCRTLPDVARVELRPPGAGLTHEPDRGPP